MLPKLVLDDVEKGGPLAEDDGFGAGFAVGCFQDAKQRFGFAAAGVSVEGEDVGALSEPGCGLDQLVDLEGFSTAHWAAVLELNDTFNTFVTEDVSACGDHWIVELFQAHWTVFPRINAQLKHVL